jgi:hypothetical protein
VATVAKQVLILSPVESIRRTRELLITDAGFGAVSVSGTRDLEHVCRRSRFDLVVIGDAYEDSLKQRLAEIVKTHSPGTPILEICRISGVIRGAEHVLYSPEPTELMTTVKGILMPATKIAPEDPASRDEGPRLLPISGRPATPDHAFTARYLELADVALNVKKIKKKPTPPKL